MAVSATFRNVMDTAKMRAGDTIPGRSRFPDVCRNSTQGIDFKWFCSTKPGQAANSPEHGSHPEIHLFELIHSYPLKKRPGPINNQQIFDIR